MKFETELNNLLERTKNIQKPISQKISIDNADIDIREYNKPSEIWVNDVEIFYYKYLQNYPLGERIRGLLSNRSVDTYTDLISCLESIKNDQSFLEQMNKEIIPNQSKRDGRMPEYDVFLSHADKDKDDLVEELYNSLIRLGIKIFYDKESLEWGDDWKQRILDGTGKSEFAIIVISRNFFGREWTEKELNEFLNRQNNEGQKLILPILHNITISQLKRKYPQIADIQAIDSKMYTCDQIALLFANQLIKRLRRD